MKIRVFTIVVIIAFLCSILLWVYKINEGMKDLSNETNIEFKNPPNATQNSGGMCSAKPEINGEQKNDSCNESDPESLLPLGMPDNCNKEFSFDLGGANSYIVKEKNNNECHIEKHKILYIVNGSSHTQKGWDCFVPMREYKKIYNLYDSNFGSKKIKHTPDLTEIKNAGAEIEKIITKYCK